MGLVVDWRSGSVVAFLVLVLRLGIGGLRGAVGFVGRGMGSKGGEGGKGGKGGHAMCQDVLEFLSRDYRQAVFDGWGPRGAVVVDQDAGVGRHDW